MNMNRMQDESSMSPEMHTMARKVLMNAAVTSIYSNDEEGPDDEFRPVKISVITKVETRDEGEAIEIDNDESCFLRVATTNDDNDERIMSEEENNDREQAEAEADAIVKESRYAATAAGHRDPPIVTTVETTESETANADAIHYTKSAESTISEMTVPAGNSGADDTPPQIAPPNNPSLNLNLPTSPQGGVSLFDTSLLDDDDDDDDEDDRDEDDLSVVSKSVVDESSKNVLEAEALAKEMQSQLAASLAEFNQSTEANEEVEAESQPPSGITETEIEHELEVPTSASSVSATRGSTECFSKENVLRSASASFDAAEADLRVELPMVSSTPESASASDPASEPTSASSSSVSSSDTTPSALLRRQRPTFRHRRPSTSSWAVIEDGDSANVTALKTAISTGFSKATKALSSVPITRQQKKILETVVLPGVFLIAALLICRTFIRFGSSNLHSSSSSSSSSSHKTLALTSTVVCIVAVITPVCALEYMLLGGLLKGTPVEEAIAKYPEVKKFLKDVRRTRLKAGWWYPSEVRTLRKDLEATNAEILLQQQESKERLNGTTGGEDEDARSLQRQMSREEHHREKTQLEKVFDGQRNDWYALKEQLIIEASAEEEKNAQLRDQLDKETQKHKQLAAQKEQMDNNIEVERAQWKFTRVSLEDALKTAVAAQEDNEITKEFFSKMEQARDDERSLWEKERDGFQTTLQRAEEDARKVEQDCEAKIKLFDEMKSAKQTQWEAERKTLKEAVKSAIDEGKTTKDALECQICQLMDANDEKYETEVRALKGKFLVTQRALEGMLEEAKKEQNVSLKCVHNLQSLLETERAEWTSSIEALEEQVNSAKAERDVAQQKLQHTEAVLEEERATKAKVAAEHETHIQKSLAQELKVKESKITSLEDSVKQLENIIKIQKTVQQSNHSRDSTEKIKNDRSRQYRRSRAAADREALKLFKPVAYVMSQDGASVASNGPSVELSSSNVGDSQSVNSNCNSESSSYYSWVQKVQETHNQEQRQLLKGLLTQHVRWQSANHHVGQLLVSSKAMLDASELSTDDEDSAEEFHKCLVSYEASHSSAKKYLDELVTMTGHKDMLEVLSEAPVVSSWTKSVDSMDSSMNDSASDPVEEVVAEEEEQKEEQQHQNQQHKGKSPPSNSDSLRSTRSVDFKSQSQSLRSTRSILLVADSIRSSRSIALLSPDSVWQKVWASLLMGRMSPFRICRTTVQTVCSGIFGSTLGMFYSRPSKQQDDESR